MNVNDKYNVENEIKISDEKVEKFKNKFNTLKLSILIWLIKNGNKQDYKFFLTKLNKFGYIKKKDLIKILLSQYNKYEKFYNILSDIKEKDKQTLINIRLYNKRFLMDYPHQTLEDLII